MTDKVHENGFVIDWDEAREVVYAAGCSWDWVNCNEPWVGQCGSLQGIVEAMIGKCEEELGKSVDRELFKDVISDQW